MAYIIDHNQCNGCKACMDECVMGAIEENEDGVMSIDGEICTDCGGCADICPEGAIRGS